jgi:predicted DNA-binding antitoxin AbrB/MazE fold protein
MLDDETGEMLEVKIRCSKRINDALEGLEPKESRKVFKQCLKELENRGLVRD